MNKKIMLAIGSMAIAAVLGLIFSQTLSVSADPDLSEEDIRQMVQTQYPGEITALELESSGSTPMYEVEIDIEGKIYLLSVDGNSGEVIQLEEKAILMAEERDKSGKSADQEETNVASSTKKEESSLGRKEKIELENEDDGEKAAVETPTNKEDKSKEPKTKDKVQKHESDEKDTKGKSRNNSGSERSIITTEQAIEIALKQFSGHVDDVELDTEDGRLLYEIEIESQRGEAEIEIDAYTGEVLVVDIDLDD